MRVWVLTYIRDADFPFQGGVVVHGVYRNFRTAEAQKETMKVKLKGRAKDFVIQRQEVK